MKVKFDMKNAATNFARAVDQLGKLTGLDRRKIVRSEAGSVLKKCFSETKKPPAQAVLTLGGRLRAMRALKLTGGGKISITSGIRGTTYGRVFLRKKDGSGYRRTHDGNFKALNQHYSDWDWNRLREAINDAKITVSKVVPEVKASAGLARQSWVLIADSLGIRLELVSGSGSASANQIQSARGARARQNKQARNGSSKVEDDPARFVITLFNRLPYGNKLGFQRTLDAAIAGRASYFQQAIRKGFAGSAADVAKLFPNWKVSTGSN